MELLDLSKIEYRLAADLKLINILLGISSHSGKYACFVCYGPCNLVSGPLRTYQHLEDMYLEYAAAGFPVKKMSLFYKSSNHASSTHLIWSSTLDIKYHYLNFT